MAFQIVCPWCKTSLTIDESQRGKQIVCRHCQKPMRLPGAPAANPAPPVPSGISQSTTAAVKSNPGANPERPLPNARGNKKEASRTGLPFALPGPSFHGIPVVLITAAGLMSLLVVVIIGVAAVSMFKSSGTQPPVAIKGAEVVAEAPQKAQPGKAPGGENGANIDAGANQPQAKQQLAKNSSASPNFTKPAVASGSGQLDREVLNKVKRATVLIKVTLRNQDVSQGSGFFAIEPGLVLTNAHVLAMLRSESPPPQKIEVTCQSGEPDSRTFTATILGVDRSSDLAILRVNGNDLPPPLEVKPAADLIETQTVYVVGFPFGKQIGENVTVSQSSVSSLRKGHDGEMVKVQVNGGMNPGNSGGPVVNTGGEVVGVAVSIIQGTGINFAVPGELVHAVSNGRLAGITPGETLRQGDKFKMEVFVDVLDPLNRVQKVSCDWWTASAGKSRPASDTAPRPLPGDSPHQHLDASYRAGRGQVDIVLPPDLAPDQLIWIQPVIVNGTGKPKWASPIAYPLSSPVDKAPALLALKHSWGARPVSVTSVNTYNVPRPGGGDFALTLNVRATLSESMMELRPGSANLRLRYLNYSLDLPEGTLSDQAEATNKFIDKLMTFVHANMTVDDRNYIRSNTIDLSSPVIQKDLQAITRKDLIDSHTQVQESLDLMAVPLPGKIMQAGATWKAKRTLILGKNAKLKTAPMDMTYKLQGVRKQFGIPQAVISIQGQSSENLKDGSNMTRTVTGTAYLDLLANQFVAANAKAQLKASDGRGQNATQAMECKMERSLGRTLLQVRDKLTNDDPRDNIGRAFKAYMVHLEAGRPCVVSMESPKAAKTDGYFDTYLRIEDAAGNELKNDDDSGVDLNSMIVFTPPETGTYKIVATCFEAKLGNYLVVVRQ